MTSPAPDGVIRGHMAEGATSNIFARGWRNLREAGPRQLTLSGLLLLVAMLLARLSWYLPVTDQAENRLFDFRSFILAEKVPQDDRITMIVYTDQTLIDARPVPSPGAAPDLICLPILGVDPVRGASSPENVLA